MISASELLRDHTDGFLRVLIMGGPKLGKTTAAVGTGPSKGVLLINCDNRATSVRGAYRLRKDFDVVMVRASKGKNHYAWADMLLALQTARDGIRDKRYDRVVVDTLSEFSEALEDECAAKTENGSGEADGRRYWPVYHKRMRHVINNLFDMKAHTIVVSHYMEVGSEDPVDGEGTPHRGVGYVPLLGGKSRGKIPAMFDDIVWMDFNNKGKRVFVTGPTGAWGPGCRSIGETVEIPADIGDLIKLFSTTNEKERPKATSIKR